MEQLKQKILLSVLICIVGVKAFAYDIEAKNEDGVTIYYNWINDKTELEVTYNYNGYSGNIVIPNSITYEDKSYNVTTIGYHAFYECKNLRCITIPSSVTSMNEAFYDCTYLSSVNINDIEAWCRISFAKSFYSNPLYYAHHLFLNGEEIKDLVIPNNVTSINDYVFNGCSELTSLTIPSSVTYIGANAFYGCI